MITFWKPEMKVFIGQIRGVLMILSGIVLMVVGAMKGEDWTLYLFVALISLAAASDIFYSWVADQKMKMIFSLLLTLIIALTGVLALTGENNIVGFAFIFFVILWILLLSMLRFAPIAEEPEKKGKKAKAKGPEPKKKNAPAPRPYPAKKAEPQKKVAEKPAPKKEEPKKEEPKKEEPKKEEPAKSESKEELPKLKVMSSREAAAAREEARKKEEPVPEPKPEPKPEPEPEPEPEAEEFDESLDLAEDTPDALLRRATWNKGLRCRRDYGEYLIPIAFVKAKVAVYVRPEPNPEDDKAAEAIRAEGWTVFQYLEKDITDGKDQAEEINKAVKENMKADRASKKKKSSKK
jgi:colicin import membrane protein